MSYNYYNVTATGTAAALTKPRTETAVLVAVSGTYGSLTFTIEGTPDGSNWSSVYAIDGVTGLLVAGGTSISPSDNLEKTWVVPSAANFTGIRVNVSAISSGTARFDFYGSTVVQQSYNVQSATTGAFTNITASGTLAVTGASTLSGAVSTGALTASSVAATGTVALTDNMTITDAKNIVLDTTTGTKIGTATTQKLGFFNATPVVQPTSTTDLRTALINLGFVATGGASPLNLNGGALTVGSVAGTGTVALTDNMTITDAKNIILNATTGTKVGTATTQKLGFYNTTPVVQPAANTDTSTGAAGGTTSVYLNTTFTGSGGTAAYTVGGVVTALKALGLLAP